LGKLLPKNKLVTNPPFLPLLLELRLKLRLELGFWDSTLITNSRYYRLGRKKRTGGRGEGLLLLEDCVVSGRSEKVTVF